MVNPINPGLPAATYGLVAPPERPASQPEPAVQVTPASKATDSNTATDGMRDGKGKHPDGASQLEETLETLNDDLKAWSTGMRFEVDPDAQRVVVSIIDSATGDVLRTVPSEAVIRVAKMIVQLQEQHADARLQGQNVDTRV